MSLDLVLLCWNVTSRQPLLFRAALQKNRWRPACVNRSSDSRPAREGAVFIHKGGAGHVVREGLMGSIGTVSTVVSQWHKSGDGPLCLEMHSSQDHAWTLCPFPLYVVISLSPLPLSLFPELLCSPSLTI